ncbi:MAG: extracellular solute-binding protein [Patescibacteria group bacterium]|nr:extracellular solute-binding protein [Patescibacteria group bacterium]
MLKKSIIVLLFFALLLTAGCGTKGVDKQTAKLMQPIILNYWRVFDGEDAFKEIIAKYQQTHPNVKINYRKLRYDEYRQELLEAFATDRGPDILSIHNTWLKEYQTKGFLAAMPDKIAMAYPVETGAIKKELTWETRTNKTLSLNQIKNNFVDIVYKDVAINVYDETNKKYTEKIYGLPLFVDTLAMYYNKDLFNNAGIANPPEYWNREFQQDVKKMTKQNNKGELIQSGVGLGGGSNIERCSDILSILMMQNGAEMMNNGGFVKFNIQPGDFKDKSYNPGLDALRFYTDFASPAKEVYSWNKSLDNSLDLFTQGRLAIMFGYSYMLPEIKANAPKLNFSIAQLPQIEGNLENINFANYWIEAVSQKSDNSDIAWDFVQFITRPEQAKLYLQKAKKPTALRSLTEEQSEDREIGIFTNQILTAESWYQGINAIAAETIIKDMIEEVITGKNTIEAAINLAARKVQQTIEE